jgi:hypothetical protein
MSAIDAAATADAQTQTRALCVLQAVFALCVLVT